jgi:hypothetical protein
MEEQGKHEPKAHLVGLRARGLFQVEIAKGLKVDKATSGLHCI